MRRSDGGRGDLVQLYSQSVERLAVAEREGQRQRAAETPVAAAIDAAAIATLPPDEAVPPSQTDRRYKGDQRLSAMAAKLATKRRRDGGSDVRWVWVLAPSSLSTKPPSRAARASRDPPGWSVAAIAVDSSVRGMRALHRLVCESHALPHSLHLRMSHCEADEDVLTNDEQVARLASGDTIIVQAQLDSS